MGRRLAFPPVAARPPHRPSRRLRSLLLLVPLVAATPAAGQLGPRLVATLEPLTPRRRSGGPARVAVHLAWKGRGLLLGRLEIVGYEDDEILGRARTAEITLASGTAQSFHLHLPAMTRSVEDSRSRVGLRFVSARGVLDLGRYKLSFPSQKVRRQLIAACGAGPGPTSRLAAVARSLALERYLPGELPGQPLVAAPDRALSTDVVALSARQMPGAAVELCAYDLVLVDADGFRRLEEKQLTALGRWIEGGGSFCLLAGGLTRLGPAPLRFLNRLGRQAGVVHAVGTGGEVVCSATDRTLYLGSELGRAVIDRRDLQTGTAVDAEGWRRVAGFLWKVRAAHLERFAPRAAWFEAAADRIGRRVAFNASTGDYYETPELNYGVTRPDAASWMGFLLPDTVRVIPFRVFVLLLGLFLLAIGPLDLAQARLFRRGWVTYVLFPLSCVGFTLVTVETARRYLGGGDQERRLVLVDVGEEGRELRRHRLELRFLGYAREVVSECRRALHASLDPASSGRAVARRARRREERAPPPWIEGRYPERYTMRQRVRQWSPQMARVLSFGAGERAGPIDWATVDREVRRPARGRAHFDALKKLDLGVRPVHVEVFHRYGTWVVASDFQPRRPAADEKAVPPFRRAVYRLSVAPEDGFLAVVSGRSPAGGASLEDLALLDVTAADQYLLVVATTAGDDIVVYRRLYTSLEDTG